MVFTVSRGVHLPPHTLYQRGSKTCMQPAAAREATSEERSTTSLGVPRIGGGSATSVRSKHIVKPTPPSSPTMPRCLFPTPNLRTRFQTTAR